MAPCPTSLCFSSLAVPSAMPQNVSLEVVNSRVSLPVLSISWPGILCAGIPAFGSLCISTICPSSLLCSWIWFWEALHFSFPQAQTPPMPRNVLIRKKIPPTASVQQRWVGIDEWDQPGVLSMPRIKEGFTPPWLFGSYSGASLLRLCYRVPLQNVVLRV